MTITTVNQPRTFVQVATEWPVLVDTWEWIEEVEVTEFSMGVGRAVGTATLIQPWYGERWVEGSILSAGLAQCADGDIVGRFVRILFEKVGGAVTIDGVACTPIWWGMIDRCRRSVTKDGGSATWDCTHILGLLDRRAVIRGYDLDPVSGNVIDNGTLRQFAGTRSATTHGVGAGVAYVTDRATVAAPVWTAAQLVQMLLLGPGGETAGGASLSELYWTVSDPLGCLSYTPPLGLDLNGKTVLEALNIVIPASRGLSWYVSVSGIPTINIVPASSAAITVGGYTTPANTATFSLNFTVDGQLRCDGYEEDWSDVADVITVEGQKPLVGITLEYRPDSSGADSLRKGWASTAESAWAAQDYDTPQSLPAWRTYYVNPEWNGRCSFPYGGTEDPTTDIVADGLRYDMERSAFNPPGPLDASYGSGGLTGARALSSITVAGSGLELEAEIPVTWGWNPNLTAWDDWFNNRSRQPMVAVLRNGTSYTPLTAGFENIGSWPCSVDKAPAAVRVGESYEQAATLKSTLDTSGGTVALLVSCAIREPHPLRVQWVRDPAEWRADVPRVMPPMQFPYAEQHRLCVGTVKGVDENGYLLRVKSTDRTMIRDDTDLLRQVLALMRRYYGEPMRAVSWTDLEFSDPAAVGYGPGSVLTTMTDATGSVTIDALVVSATYRRVAMEGPDGTPVEGWQTSYQTRRIRPSIEGFLLR